MTNQIQGIVLGLIDSPREWIKPRHPRFVYVLLIIVVAAVHGNNVAC